MPRLPAPPPLDSFTGRERELVELISPYCQLGWPDLSLVYTNAGPPSRVAISCMLKPLGEPQTSRETRAALFAAADAALNAIADAGWSWTSTPQIDIRGDRFQNEDRTWDDCYRGTLELTLAWGRAS